MSKFEVGQRVKVVADNLEALPVGQFIGRDGTVMKNGIYAGNVLVAVVDTAAVWFDEDELEAVR